MCSNIRGDEIRFHHDNGNENMDCIVVEDFKRIEKYNIHCHIVYSDSRTFGCIHFVFAKKKSAPSERLSKFHDLSYIFLFPFVWWKPFQYSIETRKSNRKFESRRPRKTGRLSIFGLCCIYEREIKNRRWIAESNWRGGVSSCTHLSYKIWYFFFSLLLYLLSSAIFIRGMCRVTFSQSNCIAHLNFHFFKLKKFLSFTHVCIGHNDVHT